jgi:hypothetical protein
MAVGVATLRGGRGTFSVSYALEARPRMIGKDDSIHHQHGGTYVPIAWICCMFPVEATLDIPAFPACPDIPEIHDFNRTGK